MGVIRRNLKKRIQRGQAIVEYIILVVIIALGALLCWPTSATVSAT